MPITQKKKPGNRSRREKVRMNQASQKAASKRVKSHVRKENGGTKSPEKYWEKDEQNAGSKRVNREVGTTQHRENRVEKKKRSQSKGRQSKKGRKK